MNSHTMQYTKKTVGKMFLIIFIDGFCTFLIKLIIYTFSDIVLFVICRIRIDFYPTIYF